MSRAKKLEFLIDWANTELGVGTIDRCIREVGIACAPVVDQLVEELQSASIVHLDELRQQRRRLTPWYVLGKLQWLWVAITTDTAVFHIGSRKKEELSHLVTDAFLGWLVTDGYKAYRNRDKRQRCLAHLIRSRDRRMWSRRPKSCSNRTVALKGFEEVNRDNCPSGLREFSVSCSTPCPSHEGLPFGQKSDSRQAQSQSPRNSQ